MSCHCNTIPLVCGGACFTLNCTNKWSYTVHDPIKIKQKCPVHGESPYNQGAVSVCTECKAKGLQVPGAKEALEAQAKHNLSLERKLRLASRLSKKAMKSGEAWDISNARDAELELYEFMNTNSLHSKISYEFEFIDSDESD